MSSKRKTPSTSTSTSKTPTTTPSQPRRSKLAKTHSLTAAQESEIHEAFSLFSTPLAGHKEGVIPLPDVRRAMVALNILPSRPSELQELLEVLDPEGEGFGEWEAFCGVCGLLVNRLAKGKGMGEEGRRREREEVEEAWGLFTAGGFGNGGGEFGGEERITLATLKRVARALKEDVDEGLLRDMILEANGGAGVGRGVEKGEFEGVLRRAGVFR